METDWKKPRYPTLVSQKWNRPRRVHLSLPRALLLSRARCSWWREKELRVSQSCPDIYFTCLLKIPESPHIPEIPNYLKNRNKHGGGCWEPIPTPADGRPWSPPSAGPGTLLHRRKQEGSASHPGTSMASELHSMPNSVQEERGEVGLSHFILFTLFIFLLFDFVLTHITCAIVKNKRGGSRNRLCCCTT